jgi:taurine dioxygenase|tara:strand:- start:1660 stop:2490 length:831 start_codon:yes stop_codon:yes gene_type:complete
MEVNPLGGVLGAEVCGIDLRRQVSDDLKAALIKEISDYQVICIRDQNLTPRQLVSASRLFGRPKTFLLRKDRIDEAPEVSIVSNHPVLADGKPLVQAKHWHTDDSYLAEPATLTFLYAKKLPVEGGDTEFINCYDVLDALPAAMRSRVGNLRAVHKYLSRRNASWVAERSPQEVAETPDVDHPLIRTHPVSRRQSLYINPNRIERILGWSNEESDLLLDELYEFAFQPQFQYRHKWRYGDLVVWDNRCTMHRANADYDVSQPRVMHRVMLEGEVPR